MSASERSSICRGFDGFKIVFGDQVYRCGAADVCSFNDLVKAVSQRIGISKPSCLSSKMCNKFVSSSSSSSSSSYGIHLKAVVPEYGDLDHDADLLKVAEAARAHKLKHVRLAVSVSELPPQGVTEDGDQKMSISRKASSSTSNWICSSCGAEILQFPSFACLACSWKICAVCESSAEDVHEHPLMKLVKSEQLACFSTMIKIIESSGTMLSAASRSSEVNEESISSCQVPSADLDPNRLEHNLEDLSDRLLQFSGPNHSVEKHCPILRNSVSLPVLGGIDSSVESLTTPKSSLIGTPSCKKMSSQFVATASNGVAPGTMVEGGSHFLAGWKVRNNGTSDWPSDLNVVHVKGPHIPLFEDSESKGGNSHFEYFVVPALKVQEEGEIMATFVAPKVTKPTTMLCFWRLAHGDECFGQRLKLEIDVIPPTMSFKDRQMRRIEQFGFTNRALIEQAVNEAGNDMDRAVMIVVKRQSELNTGRQVSSQH
eukprot:TRINITY_DN496_c0_g1_i1.p1 TRINITY_DN496_c0_g1~~TRINITY_DN496_c0_g1_i1.p1  ORF type:complete len:485 (-),score=121.51 TRINITY_DN496_c0_g1_i1:47-1501(-)